MMSSEVNDTQRVPVGTPARDAGPRPPEAPAHDSEPDFETLLAAYEGRTQSFSEGEVIKGRVIAISNGGVVVDVGFKSEGIIPLEQFMDDHGRTSLKVGDVVDV